MHMQRGFSNVSTSVGHGTLNFPSSKRWRHLAQYFLRTENKRTVDNGQTIRKLMWNLCQPSKTEWLFNNIRGMALHPYSHRCIIPHGVTSNESMNRQLNCVYRNNGYGVYYTTVEQRLEYFGLNRLNAHEQATANATIQQLRQVDVRALGETSNPILTFTQRDLPQMRQSILNGLPRCTRRAELEQMIEEFENTKSGIVKKTSKGGFGSSKRPAAKSPTLNLRMPASIRVKRTAFTMRRVW